MSQQFKEESKRGWYPVSPSVLPVCNLETGRFWGSSWLFLVGKACGDQPWRVPLKSAHFSTGLFSDWDKSVCSLPLLRVGTSACLELYLAALMASGHLRWPCLPRWGHWIRAAAPVLPPLWFPQGWSLVSRQIVVLTLISVFRFCFLTFSVIVWTV